MAFGNSSNDAGHWMIRSEMLKDVESFFDVIIIGGGATGLGAAVDAASRGYKTLLLEGSDFSKGTSSRSTKLIHGGLRYLRQGNLALVMEALKERGLLCQNAPHLIHHLPFVVPCYRFWEKAFYRVGLKIYDLLAGSLQIESSHAMKREDLMTSMPSIRQQDLTGGVLYFDGQFDDARLAIALAKTAVSLGAILLNYTPVTELIKKDGKCVGVKAKDLESGNSLIAHGKVVINATGVFTDQLLHLDDAKNPSMMAPSRGIHLVIDKELFPGKHALLIPKTRDGRVLFIIPWLGSVLIGTTDTYEPSVSLEPSYSEQEVDFLLKQASSFLEKSLLRSDIKSVFSGLRPLMKAGKQKTAQLSREHHIVVSSSDLITIIGGKWTTYRKMAEDVIDRALSVGKLEKIKSQTQTLKLAGFDPTIQPFSFLSTYGTQRKKLENLIQNNPELGKKIDHELPYTFAEIQFAIEEEMACTLDDLLSRRTRSLFLNAQAAIRAAPKVLKFLTALKKKDALWENQELHHFYTLAKHYDLPH